MKKNNSVEFLRFLFSVIIVYFHITHSNIMPYIGENEVYLKVQGMTSWASAIVECFLLLSGYMIYASFRRTPNKPFIVYAVNRLIRLWPVFAFYVVCSLLLGGNITEDTMLDLFFLRCTGISLSYAGIIWYIGPFFWGSLLVYAILKYVKPGMTGLVLAFFVYWGYAVNLNTLNGGVGRDIAYEFISLGMLRVLAGISLGTLIAMGVEAFQKEYASSHLSQFSAVLASVLEICSLGLLLKIFLINKQPFRNVISVVILFSLLLVCFILNRGVLSRLLNAQPLSSVFSFFGKYSYSIYVMQQISFNILAKTLWQNTDFICHHEVFTLLISTAFSVFVGMCTYHLVEKPAVAMYKKWIAKHTPQQPCNT